jgi:hypothetical protein
VAGRVWEEVADDGGGMSSDQRGVTERKAAAVILAMKRVKRQQWRKGESWERESIWRGFGGDDLWIYCSRLRRGPGLMMEGFWKGSKRGEIGNRLKACWQSVVIYTW